MPVNLNDDEVLTTIEDAVDEIEEEEEKGIFTIYLSYACQKVDDVDEAIQLARDAMTEVA